MKSDTIPQKTASSICVIGYPGTGKTSLSIQVFGDKGLAILDTDNNLAGAIPYIRRLNNGKLPAFDYEVPLMKDDKIVPRGDRWAVSTAHVNTWLKDPSIRYIAIDTLTALVEFCMDDVRKNANRKIADGDKIKEDDVFREQDWGAFKMKMKHFLITIKASGKTLILNTHISVWEDKLTEIAQEFIACPGSLKNEIAGLFTEVWILSIEEKRVGTVVEYNRQIKIAPGPAQQRLGLKSAAGLAPKKILSISELQTLFT